MFRFANPQYLWLLLAVPALVALYWLAARNRRRRLARFGRPGILEELHGRPTQLLDRLLSKYPAHRIRNVTFSTSVRSYNARDSLVEFKYNFVCK